MLFRLPAFTSMSSARPSIPRRRRQRQHQPPAPSPAWASRTLRILIHNHKGKKLEHGRHRQHLSTPGRRRCARAEHRTSCMPAMGLRLLAGRRGQAPGILPRPGWDREQSHTLGCWAGSAGCRPGSIGSAAVAVSAWPSHAPVRSRDGKLAHSRWRNPS